MSEADAIIPCGTRSTSTGSGGRSPPSTWPTPTATRRRSPTQAGRRCCDAPISGIRQRLLRSHRSLYPRFGGRARHAGPPADPHLHRGPRLPPQLRLRQGRCVTMSWTPECGWDPLPHRRHRRRQWANGSRTGHSPTTSARRPATNADRAWAFALANAQAERSGDALPLAQPRVTQGSPLGARWPPSRCDPCSAAVCTRWPSSTSSSWRVRTDFRNWPPSELFHSLQ